MEEDLIFRIKQIVRERASGNVSQCARHINIEQTRLNNCLIGKRKPSLDICARILTAFPDISAEWLMRGEGPMHKGDGAATHVNHIDLSTGKTAGSNSPSVVGDNNAIASGDNSSVGASDDIIRQLLAQNQQLISLITNNNKQ